MKFEEATEVLCDLCGSDDAVEVPHCREYTNDQPIHICKSCGLVYFKYRRSPSALAKFWEEEMFASGEYTSHNPTFRSRHAYAVEFLKKHIGLDGKFLVDIGAGEGQFLEYIKREGAEVFGVESAKRNSEILARLEIPHFTGTIEDYVHEASAKKGSFRSADVATILWTLQNSQSCIDMLNGANFILKEKGYVFIQLGSRVLVPFKKPLSCYFSTLPQDDQPYHFSINTLQGALAKSHFEITHTNYYWDEDLMCVLAQKQPDDKVINWKKDDYREVADFFERWHAETQLMKKYVTMLPLDYHLTKTHTFYNR